MQNLFRVTVLLACSWLFLPPLAGAADTVRVGLYQNPPLIELDSAQTPQGLFIDLLNRVAAKERWQLSFRSCGWAECLQLLDQGEIDLIPAIAPTPEREEHYSFSAEPVVSNWGKIFSLPNRNFESILDLDGQKVALVAGDIYGARLKVLAKGFNISPQWVEVDDMPSVMGSLEAGRADAGVVSRIFAMANASGYDAVETSVVFQPTTLHFAAPKAWGASLLDAIDRHLHSEKQNRGSAYYSSLALWLHQRQTNILPPWFKSFLLIAISILGFSIAFNLLLRARVRVGTRQLKTALDLAQESRANINAILNSIGDGLLVTDTGGLIRKMNPAAERLLGIESHKVLRRPLEHLFGELGLAPELATALAVRSGSTPVEWTLPQQQGHELQLQARSAPVQSNIGQPGGAITILRDVTREREAERLKSEFISTAAHELNTPLTSILGFSELLLEEKNLTPEQRRDCLSTIYAKGEALSRIVDDLLNLSRIEAGKILVVEKTPCDITGLVSAIVGQYRVKSTKHRFDLQLPDETLILPADQGKIVQVMENLLSNAVKYSPKGGTIDLEAAVAGDFYRLKISDPGIGMTAEQVERIFDKFYRADATNTAVEGLGLGMSIARNIVEAHGGTIQVVSQPGEGTQVTFSLKLAPAAEVSDSN